jgi:hypothetical protein
MPTNPTSQENAAMTILDEATKAAKSYYDGSLVVGEDRGRRECAYAMGWIHGKAATQVLEGDLTYFVGNANGRGLIRIEVAGTGEHIASMPRGTASEARAAQIVSRFNSHASDQRRIKELEEGLEAACIDMEARALDFGRQLLPRLESVTRLNRARALLSQGAPK